MSGLRLERGDCAEVMASMESNSVDAIVTDPPYGLAFMGADWDSFGASTGRESIDERRDKMNEYLGANAVVPAFASSHSHMPKLSEMREFQKRMTPIFAEALRVAKPGAHLLCFGGTRTFHRMACAIEEAGWEVRDCIMWVTGQGFPKSMDVGKAIDKALGKKREKVPNPNNAKPSPQDTGRYGAYGPTDYVEPTPATDAAARWDGWGTCLKPAWEPIIVARKPLDGTVAHNVLTWGVGAINIDGCRVPTDETIENHSRSAEAAVSKGKYGDSAAQETHQTNGQSLGRFPANLVHDGSQMVLDLFPDTGRSSGGGGVKAPGKNGIYGSYGGHEYPQQLGMGDSGSAARFFYCAKANKKDRNYGCERLLTWAERDQELTQLLEQASSLLARDISESMMLNLVEQGCSTLLFGNESTVLSQEECRFITSTVIPLITASKTCSSSPRSNTSEFILDAIRTSEESGISLARLADKSSQSRQDSTSGGTDTATSAVSALFGVLSEIRGRARVGNFHCTVKPIALMSWLVRLVTPQGGVVLDPFMGSGSTGVAAKREGMGFIGIERDGHYFEIASRRLESEPATLF